MKVYLVKYQGLSAVVAAEGVAHAKDAFQNKFSAEAGDADRRQIGASAVPGLDYTGPELSKPKVLKSA